MPIVLPINKTARSVLVVYMLLITVITKITISFIEKSFIVLLLNFYTIVKNDAKPMLSKTKVDSSNYKNKILQLQLLSKNNATK